jgi:type IV pilus assembly protein PilB
MGLTTDYLNSFAAPHAAEVSKLVDCIIRDAIVMRASDIHFDGWEDSVAVRVRTSGMLTELVHLPLEFKERIAGRVKVMANLASHLTGVPQDGKANMGADFGNVQLRVSIIPTIHGEAIVCRIFDPNSRTFDINSLGFDETTLKAYVNLLNKPNGLILLTGPTGSGKTTAIYSSLFHLISKYGTTINIASVEDPVEVPLATVRQSPLNAANDYTYAAALKALMRQDPQVIMLGEIRDPETANIAVQAGLTGHLVISTLHSGSTTGCFARLINMNIEPFLLASSILGIMGVRLVRKNCPHCSVPYQPESVLLKSILEPDLDRANFLRGTGCPECSYTGCSGRLSLCELLIVNEDLRDAVLEKRPTRQLQEIAILGGMRTLWQSGLEQALSGLCTLEEVARKTAVDQI